MKRKKFLNLFGIGFLAGCLFGMKKKPVRVKKVKEAPKTEIEDEGGFLVPEEYVEEVLRIAEMEKRILYGDPSALKPTGIIFAKEFKI